MVAAETPTLAKIKNDISLNDCRALLSIAICEVCDFFNIGKNMNDTQVALTVDLIIEEFWHLKLEEIKFCLRRAMRNEKLYDRLDGNIIIGWLRAYDNERTEEAMRISDSEAARQANSADENADAVSYEEYLQDLATRAKSDNRAASLLSEIENPAPGRMQLASSETRHEKDVAFKQWFYRQYLNDKQRKSK